MTVVEYFAALEHIFRTVYRVVDVSASPFFADMKRQAGQWPDGLMRFR
jgi:hypothetical protein